MAGVLDGFSPVAPGYVRFDTAIDPTTLPESPMASSEPTSSVQLIDVDYDVLPVVLDGRQAMRDDAPLLHERLMPLANPHIRPGGLRDEDDAGRGSNLANQFVFEVGDVAQGFRDADVVVEREYGTAPVHQGYIEPHCATAHWGADGQ